MIGLLSSLEIYVSLMHCAEGNVRACVALRFIHNVCKFGAHSYQYASGNPEFEVVGLWTGVKAAGGVAAASLT